MGNGKQYCEGFKEKLSAEELRDLYVTVGDRDNDGRADASNLSIGWPRKKKCNSSS